MFRPFKKRVGALVILWVLAAALFMPGAVLAQAAGGVTLTMLAGFNGYCRARTWIPVKVSLNNTGPDIEGRLEVTQSPQGPSQKIFAQAVTLPGQTRKVLTLYVYPDGYLDSLNVRLVGAGGQVATATAKLICISPSDRLIGILADSPTPFNILSKLNPDNGKTYLALLGTDEVPDKADALGSLDTLVVSNIDTGTLTPGQQAALFSWIVRGGRLVVTGGTDWKRTAAGFDPVLPIQPGGTQTISSLGGLAKFIGKDDALTKDTVVVQANLLRTGTQKWISQGDAALVLQRPIGLGTVIYMTFDPAVEPFSGWSVKEDFYRQLLGVEISRPVWGWGFQDWAAASMAVHDFPNRRTPGGIEIFGFLLVYIIVIGPINALALRRIKRKELAWVTIPGLVVLFSLVAFIYGAVIYTNQPVLNRLAVVQINPDDKQAHIDGLIGIMSPVQSPYSIEAGSGLLVHPLPIASQAENLSSNSSWTFEESSGGASVIDSPHVDPTGFAALAVEGQVPAADIHGDLSLQVNGKDMLLSGLVNNNSDISLEDVVLITPGGLQKLEPLKAHSSLDIHLPIQAKDAQAISNGFSRPKAGSILGLFTQGNDDQWIAGLTGAPLVSLLADQRYALLSAFAGANANENGNQGKIYLAAWSSASPLEVKLVGQAAEDIHSTFYLVSINCKSVLQGTTAVIEPLLFNWQVLHFSGLNSPSPYRSYLGPGKTSFIYRPALRNMFKSVSSLVLHLENENDSGIVPYIVSLWDNSIQAWTPLQVVGWGDQPIASPDKYVTPDGEVRLQLENTGNSAPFLKRVDFTLEVHP